MDWEGMAANTEIVGNYRTLEVAPGAKISWYSKVVMHHSAYGSATPPIALRMNHQFENYFWSCSIFADFDLPPTAFMQRCFDAMVAGTTIPLTLGIALCNPVDRFVRATGRKLAIEKAITQQILPRSIVKTHRGEMVMEFLLAPKEGKKTRYDTVLTSFSFLVVVSPEGRYSMRLG